MQIIGIDARPLIKKKVGFGYYVENLLIEILKKDKINQYILLSDREIYFDDSKYNNIRKVIYPNGLVFKKSFYYYYKLNHFLSNNDIHLDLFWGTEHILPRSLPKDTKKILTVADFTHLKYPKSTTSFNRFVMGIMFKPSIQNADQIVCISHSTERELKQYFSSDLKGQKISTIYLSGNEKNNPNLNYDDEISEKVKTIANDKFILFIGTIEPRKSIITLIEAAPKLKGILHVVICGKIGWENKSVVDQLSTTANLTYLSYVSQKEKVLLMNKCFCQVQPSIYEGFGLPVVECMQEGGISVVANNSSLQEIVEMDALKFQTSSSEDLVLKLKKLNDDKSLYKEAKKYCKIRGKEFSWEKAAEQYLKVFSELNSND